VSNKLIMTIHTTPNHNRFTALFPRPPGWASARRELLDFMVQGKIKRQTHRQSDWAPLHPDYVVPTSIIPHVFTDRMPFLPPNQQCQSTEGKFYMMITPMKTRYTCIRGGGIMAEGPVLGSNSSLLWFTSQYSYSVASCTSESEPWPIHRNCWNRSLKSSIGEKFSCANPIAHTRK